MVSRKKFIESHGATCANWSWSWSFINEIQKTIIFGVWEDYAQNKSQQIFDQAWKTKANGHKNNGYAQSLEHIRLIEEEGYSLKTYLMYLSNERRGDNGVGPAKIKGFEPVLESKSLTRIGTQWFAHTATDIIPPFPEEVGVDYPEGARRQIYVNAYERNPEARQICIQHHKCRCKACDFDFEKEFGELGKGYIHVHHLVEVSSYAGAEYNIDPINDLVPLCPNCHAMIHKTQPMLSIEVLKEHRRLIQN